MDKRMIERGNIIKQQLLDLCVDDWMDVMQLSALVGLNKGTVNHHLTYLLKCEPPYVKRISTDGINNKKFLYMTVVQNYVPLEFGVFNPDRGRYNFVPYKPEHVVVKHNVRGEVYLAEDYLNRKIVEDEKTTYYQAQSRRINSDRQSSYHKQGAISTGGVELV